MAKTKAKNKNVAEAIFKPTKVDYVAEAVVHINKAADLLDEKFKETANTEVMYQVKANDFRRLAKRLS